MSERDRDLGTQRRPPIEVRCDEAMTAALTRAGVTRALRGPTGVGVTLGAALGAATAVLLLRSVLVGAVVAAVAVAFQAGLVVRHGRRSIHLAASPGQVLTTAYDDQGRMVLTTGMGTATLEAGSADRVRRGRRVVAFRHRQGRSWALLPTELLTDDDARFLLGERDGQRPQPSTPTPQHLPLMHVVTPQSQRGVQAAVTRLAWRSADGVMSTIGLLLFLAWAAWAPGLVSLALAGAMALGFLAFLTAPARAVRRVLPVGQVVMADVTDRGLTVLQGPERGFLPWPSFRSVRVTAQAVVLVAGAAGTLVLPRDLFPAGDLGRLQEGVQKARAETH